MKRMWKIATVFWMLSFVMGCAPDSGKTYKVTFTNKSNSTTHSVECDYYRITPGSSVFWESISVHSPNGQSIIYSSYSYTWEIQEIEKPQPEVKTVVVHDTPAGQRFMWGAAYFAGGFAIIGAAILLVFLLMTWTAKNCGRIRKNV